MQKTLYIQYLETADPAFFDQSDALRIEGNELIIEIG